MSLHKLPSLMLDLFRGRREYIAVASDDGKFAPVHKPEGITTEYLIENHLAGIHCLGFYLLDDAARVHCSCVDFDNKPHDPDPAWREKAERVYWELVGARVQPLVERSQSGSGCHIWLFFSEPVDAWLARGWWELVGAKLDIKFREVFPKQVAHTGKGLGNLVRYPMWNESAIVDPEDDWTEADPVAFMQRVERYSAADLRMFAWQMKLGDVVQPVTADSTVTVTGGEGLSGRVRKLVDQPWSLLGRRWIGDTRGMSDGSPSAVAMSIATELVRLYVPTQEIEAAVRYWLRMNGRGDKADRPDWIATTVAKAYGFVSEKVEEKSVQAGVLTLADCVDSYLDILQKGGIHHFASGLRELDKCIDGVAPGEVCVIGARPSHGKSAFAFQWLDNASSQGVTGLCISEEMSKDEIGKRRLQSITDVEYDRWNRDCVPKMREQAKKHFAGRQPVYVVENCATAERVEEVINQMCGIYGVRMVAVDYLQLLGGRGDRYEVVTEASRRIKQCAQRNNCAVLLLSQFSRSIEGRDDADGRQPKLSDFRESGQIEQDADLAMALEWPYRTNPKKNADVPNKYVVTVMKRRNGPIRQVRHDLPAGVVLTTFNPSTQVIGSQKNP